MEKEFIPYKQALSLKELGFCEPCFGYYTMHDSYLFQNKVKSVPEGFILAPTHQQAFRFFRNKHNLDSWIYCPNKSKEYFAVILKHKRFVSYNEQFDTYEEAELACLNKLIEIVKNGNKS